MGATLIVAVAAVGALCAACRPAAGQSFEFALLGDNPYGQENVSKFEALIEDVNRRDGIQWVIHVGDTKAGSDACSDELLRGRFDLYQGFDAPFVLTPGDNDWFDCVQEGAGAYDGYERLDFLRGLFFPVPERTTGGRPMAVRTQASEPSFGEFVENVMWTREDVVFSTLHLVRTARPPSDPAVAERRMDAAIDWVRRTFKLAHELDSPGVFMATQADLWMAWGLPGVLRVACPQCLLPSAGMERIYPVLVEQSLAFGRPVVLAVGDTHIFRVDKPLYDPETRRLVENFTRVETFGSPSLHWVRVVVDPGEPQVFSFHQQIVTANASAPSAQFRVTRTEQESGTRVLLQAVSTVSDQVVWVSGHGGTFAVTTDGGDSWTARVMPGEETLQFRDIDAFSAETAYLMSAGGGTVSRIYRTDDGGATWNLQFRNEHPDGFFDCMAFWDVDHGIVYGDEIEGQLFILRTEDGGASWNRVPPNALPPAQEGEGGFAASGSCVATGTDGRAWIATGNGERARVLVTEDGGRSWSDSAVPVPGGSAAGLTTIGFLDDETGLALGGTIGQDTVRVDNVTVTSDGGRTWTSGGRPRMAGPVYGSSWVPGAPSPTSFAVGPGGADFSTDGGRSWRAADRRTYWAVSFVSPMRGWAVGPQGRITRFGFRSR